MELDISFILGAITFGILLLPNFHLLLVGLIVFFDDLCDSIFGI